MERIIYQPSDVNCIASVTCESNAAAAAGRKKSKSLLSLRAAISFFVLAAVFALLPQISNAQPCSWNGGSGYNDTPACGSYTQRSVGSGTYTYANLYRGANYEISTCGSSFDTQLSIYDANPAWSYRAGGDDNGPYCSGGNASVNYTSTYTGSNFSSNLIIVSRYNCQLHDFTGASALLKYQQISPSLSASTTTPCPGASVTISSSQDNLGMGSWTLLTVGGGSFSPSTGNSTTYTPNSATQTNTMRYTIGLCSPTINITSSAFPSVTISGPSNICAGSSAAFTTQVFAGSGSNVTYRFWRNSSVLLAGPTSVASGTVVSLPSQTTAGNYHVDVVNSNNAGCSVVNSSQIQLNVNANPTAGPITCSNCLPGSYVCYNSSVTLNANAVANCGSINTYQWYRNSSPIAGGGATFIATLPGTYHVVVTNSCAPGCSATSATFTLNQNPQIVADAGPNRTVCPNPPGNSTVLGGSPSGSGGTGSLTYAWSPATALNSTTIANPTVTNLASTTLYTLTVTDSKGCTAIKSVTVTVGDVTPPGISCPANISVNATSGACSASVSTANPTISDNCSVTALTYSVTGATSYSSPGSGINYLGTKTFNTKSNSIPTNVSTVAYTVVDQSGLTAACTFTVTVIDNQNPDVVCPADIVRNNDAGVCGAVVSYSASTSDNCGIASGVVSPGLYPGSTFPVGVTTNVITVTDYSGNTDVCSFTVTVNDNEKPSITCPADMSQNANASCVATVTYSVTAGDNCPGVVTNLSGGLGSGSSFPLGNTTVTWKATDAKGNTRTCSFVVTVNDVTDPTITCPGNISVFNSVGQCGTNVTYATPTSADNCSGVGAALTSGLASGVFYPVGVTTNVWTATDGSGNTKTCSFTVTVVDNKPPTPVCQNLTVNLSSLGAASITASQVNNGSSDECGVQSLSINTSNFGCANVGNNTVILTVTDVNGNSNTCSSTVLVKDITAPVPQCQNFTVNLSSGPPAGATATITPANINNGSSDACPFTLSLSQSSFNCSHAFAVSGNQGVILTVTDASLNTATCSAFVTVRDVNAPSPLCKNITIQLNASGNASITPSQLDNGTTDNCSFTLAISQSAFTCAHVSTSPNTVTLTATDPTGNSASCNSGVTVQDLVAPTPGCKNITVDLSATGSATTAHNAINNGSSDACGIATFSSSKTSWKCANVGNNTVTLTVTDVNGNTSTCNGTVAVRDVTIPNAVCQNITIQLDAFGSQSIVASQVNGGSWDSCGIANLAVFPTTFSCSQTVQYGVQQVVLTVTDVNANQNTCMANVTVMDTVRPVAVCKDYTIELDFAGNAPVYATDLNNGSSDACGIDLLGITGTLSTGTYTNVSQVAVGCDDVDTSPNQVKLVVTDDNGNTRTCNANITVLDNTPPVLECYEVSVFTDPGVCEADVTIPAVSVVDNCVLSGVTVTNDGNGNDGNDASGIYPEGITTVTWTVTDAFNNSDTCQFHVTVTDNELPTAMDPPNQFFLMNPGVCYASAIVQPLINVNDNCGIATVTNSHTGTNNASGNYPDGITVVVWTITDVNGNIANKMQFIAVIDLQLPQLVSGTCPGPVTVGTDPGVCKADVTLTAPQYTDNCGIGFIVATVNNVIINSVHDNFNLGSTTIVWKALDIHSNFNTQCSQVITVFDDENPAITCPANKNQNTDPGVCNAVVNISVPVTSDNCSVASVVNSKDGDNNASGTYPLGLTTVVYTVTDGSSNTTTCSFTVNITDAELPGITCPVSQTVSTDLGVCEAGVTVLAPATSDNCGVASALNNYNGTSDGSDTYPIGTTNVRWTVTDNSGNTRTCTHSITVNDNEDPTITCPPDENLGVDAGLCGNNLTIAAPVTDDNCGVDLVLNDYNGTDDASDYYPVGSHTVLWGVLDVHGLVSFCNQQINISDDEIPAITCAAAQSDSTDPGQCQANVTVTGPVYSDNCGVDLMLNDYTGTDDASGIYYVGTTTVLWGVLDIYGNVNFCTQDITVTDYELPSITCGAAQTQTADPGVCQAYVVVTGPATGDNCGVDLVANDRTGTEIGDDVYPVGTTTLTWGVLDIYGNVNFCTQDITVTDDEDPSITCAPGQTQTADAGECQAAVTVTSPLSSGDNCGVATVLNNYNGTVDASDTYPVGTTTIIWTVTDIHNNASTCTQAITITDDEDPTISCAADQSQDTDPGLCTATVTVTGPGSGDNCGVASVVNNYNGTSDASDVYPIGTTTITWTVTDIHGHAVQCTQDITISDNEDPSITCAADQTQTADPTVCQAAVTVIGPGSGDNCGVATVINDRNSTSNASGTYPVGTTTLTWTVTDIYGNSSQCTQDITVTDDEDPLVSCPADVVQNTDPGVCVAAVTIGVPPTSDNCGVATVVNSKNGTNNASDTYALGTTVVTYTVTDIHGNSTTCSFSVLITDAELPTITCPTNKVLNNTVDLCTGTVVINVPPTNDNCGVATVVNNYNGTNNASDTYDVGTTTVTYTVTDVNGNFNTCSFTVTVNDVQVPEFPCPADIVQTADPGACDAAVTFAEPLPWDNCDVDTIMNDYNFKANGSDVYPVGTTTLLWTAIDVHGNTTTCTQNITITDDEDPVIQCEPGMAQTNDPGECGADMTVISPAASDNCGIASLVNSANGTSDASGFYPVGITNILWTLTDIHGHVVSCNQVITITDDENAVIVCPADVLQTADIAQCQAAVFIPLPLTSDNCAVDIYGADYTGWSENASGMYPVGTTTVEYKILDIYSNLDSCSFTVTITDDENPFIICPNDIIYGNDAGECEAGVTVVVPLTSDNCGVASVVNDYNGTNDASDDYVVGTTTVVYTVTDIHANSATCSFTVTVNDHESPTITCPADVNQTADPGECEADVTIAVPPTGDNCAVATVVNDKNGTNDASDTYDVGTEIVTYTVTDIYGNSIVCSFSVTITDDEIPSITCPADITQTADAGECEAGVTIALPVVDDNCDVDMILHVLSTDTNDVQMGDASGDFAVGTTEVTYAVIDIHDNYNICFFTVTITDDEDPTITCPANQVVNTDPNVCTRAIVIAVPGTGDNCSVASVVNDYNGTNNASDTYNLGLTTVTYTVTDIHSNSTTCSFTITVNDQQVPTITCPDDIIQSADPGLCSAAVTVPVPPAYWDNCTVVTVLNDYNGTADASDVYDVGVTIVEWTVTDQSGNTADCAMSILVFDDEDPVIYNCPADINVIATDPDDCDPQVFWTEPTASDNCSYTLTSNYHPGDEFDVDPGSFSVNYLAVDPSGNTATCSFVVNVDPTPLVLTSDTSEYQCGFNITCHGASDGWIDLTVDGACRPYTYAWTGPNGFTASTEDITGLVAGQYCYTVTDSRLQGYPGNGQSTNGCITLVEPDELVITELSSDTVECGFNITCHGASDGAINLDLDGGAECLAYTYAWTGPGGFTASTEDLANLGPGTYNVTITDANACSTSGSITLTEPDELVITELSSDTVECGFNISCNGASDGAINLDLDGGAECLAYTYAWTGPGGFTASTEDLANLGPGTYNVTITDANGCSTSGSITLTEPDELVITDLSSPVFACGFNITCHGASDGSINLDLDGGAECLAYTYAWTGPGGFTASTEDLANLGPGTYNVTITDANACSTSGNITLTEPDSLLASGVKSVYECGFNISCHGYNDGSIDVTVTGGCTPYTFAWTTPNGSGLTPGAEDQSGLTRGIYRVLITDPNGCSRLLVFTLTEPDALAVTDLSSPTYPGGWNVTCSGANDGSINLDVTGGAICEPYSYQWTGPDTVFITVDTVATNLTLSGYVVEEVSNDGSGSSSSYHWSSSSRSGSYCGGGGSDGGSAGCDISYREEVAGAPDGSGGIWYSIGDKCIFELIHEVPAGTTLTIRWRQKPGQSGTSSMKVYTSADGVIYGPHASSPLNTTNEAYFDQTLVAGAPTRYVWLEAAASPDFQVDAITYSFVQTTYQIVVDTTTGGAFTATTEDLSGLWAGEYCVTVTDVNGCSIDSCITLTQPDPVDLGVCDDQTVVLGYYPENVAVITTNVTGGLPPYNYYWSTGENTASIEVAPTVTTTYTVTVTSQNGCIGFGSHTVTVVDIRCGSGLDRVSMCNTSNKNYCVKESDVPGKLALGWTLGECTGGSQNALCSNGIDDDHDGLTDCADPACFGTPVCGADYPIDLSNGNCGAPVIEGCACDGGIKSYTVQYTGTSGVTIKAYSGTGHSGLLATFSNVQNGDQLTVNAAGSGVLNTYTYFEIVGASPDVAVFTGCGSFTVSGNATAVYSSAGVPDAADATGSVNSSGAELYDSGDNIVLTLGHTIPAGTTYKLYWRQKPFQSGTSTLAVSESSDGSTFTANGSSPLSTYWEYYFYTSLTAGSATKYVKVEATSGNDLNVDAITYTYSVPQGVGLVSGPFTTTSFVDRMNSTCNGDVPSCNICEPDGYIKLLAVKYYGSSGALVKVRNYPSQNVIQVFYNVQNGDELIVNGTFNTGSKLDDVTYLEVVSSPTAPYASIPTSCINGKGEALIGRTFGNFKVTGVTDNRNYTCGMDAPCACSGGISFLGLIYNGTAGGTVKAYAKSNHQNLLQTYSNLQPGDSILVRSDVLNMSKFNTNTYFELVGYIPDIAINTSCADYITGMEYGPLTVYGYVDKNGGLCNMTPPPACPCDGGISSVTIDYDVFDSLSIGDATVNFYTDLLHTTLIASFTDVDPGEVLVVSASALPGGVFGSVTFVQIVGSGRPDIKLPTSCEKAVDELIGSSFRELFVQSYTDAQGHGCDNECGVGKTLMCHNAVSSSSWSFSFGHWHCSGGAREQCVKNKDVNKKLQTGDWTLGPCPDDAKPDQLITTGGEGFELTAQPNPFSETTTISFRLAEEERVSLVVYDVAGEEVAKLFEGVAEKDQLYQMEFKAAMNPDGMYFYRLVTESGDVYIRKLVQTKQ